MWTLHYKLVKSHLSPVWFNSVQLYSSPKGSSLLQDVSFKSLQSFLVESYSCGLEVSLLRISTLQMINMNHWMFRKTQNDGYLCYKNSITIIINIITVLFSRCFTEEGYCMTSCYISALMEVWLKSSLEDINSSEVKQAVSCHHQSMLKAHT